MTTATETATAARFTLDEDKAREWLAHSVTHYDTGKCDREPACKQELADIGADWDPRDNDEHTTALTNLVYEAQQAGIIAAPGRTTVEYQDASDENEAGYRWEVLARPEAGPWLTLNGHYEKAWHIGEPDVTGAGAALAILREAVSTANRVLDDLDRYAAGQLAALLPRGEWGSDELGTVANWLAGLGYDMSDEGERRLRPDGQARHVGRVRSRAAARGAGRCSTPASERDYPHRLKSSPARVPGMSRERGPARVTRTAHQISLLPEGKTDMPATRRTAVTAGRRDASAYLARMREDFHTLTGEVLCDLAEAFMAGRARRRKRRAMRAVAGPVPARARIFPH